MHYFSITKDVVFVVYMLMQACDLMKQLMKIEDSQGFGQSYRNEMVSTNMCHKEQFS